MSQETPATAAVPLSNATVDLLPQSVERPLYDRNALTPGIVHIGLGNFHRAHQAWYLHRLMQTGSAQDWAILGAGVRRYDAEMRKKLLAQDCLTTLIELDPAGSSAEVLGSMIDYLPVEDGHGALIAAMADPAIRIVSLTVTEGGYYQHVKRGGLDADHPDIVHDVANPDRPRTAFGAMVAALRQRRSSGAAPFTGLSCDNLQGNGDVLRGTVVGLAELTDPDLARWIDAHGAFPNSMVDCIVPATGPDEIALAHRIGVADAVPVTHESYRQWVIEDRFVAGRPDWGTVGVTMTDDVHTYETMKIRILNAGHQVIANIGELLAVPTISECMANPVILAFWRKVEETAIAPYVEPVPGTSPAEYIDLVERRFTNPLILDTTRRVAFDGSSRHPGFLHPILREALQAGDPIEGLALVEALWARMCHGTREDGSIIEPNDPNWPDLQRTAKQARTRPDAWLRQHQVYSDLAQNVIFAESFARWLALIWSEGVESALKVYLRRG